MFRIDWHQLEKNIDSREVSFESFNYQIAVKKYASYGKFEYYYNTPGSEFYLILNKDCEEQSAKKGAVIGWQAKFWLNKSAPDNSPLGANHRRELIGGFKKSLEYKPELNVWIICTPGRFINTAPSYPVDELEKSLKTIKPDINISYWHKEHYEAIFHSVPEQYASIFNYYFSTQYIGFNLFLKHSGKRLDILRKRYDTDLYTPGKDDKKILSSIFYKNHFEKLNDRIKHSLEDREKLVKSYLYETVINKFITSTDNNKVAEFQKELIQKFKSLIDELSAILEKLHIYNDQEQTLQFIKQLFNIIEAQWESLNNLINEAGLDGRPGFNIHLNYDSDINEDNVDIDEVYYILCTLNSLAWNLLEKTENIYDLLFHISRQVFNIFGEAGFGKTNFACSITEHLLSKKLPVLLIPASEIRGGGESIEKQILNFFDIDGSISFNDFVGMLDNLGFSRGIKVPIIIDGLNETQPSAAVWHPQLAYLIKEIETFENVMLITTCRVAYVKQVFDEDDVENVPQSSMMEGFQENLDEAIEKYFSKYNISPQNKDFDKNIFKNPLLLSIFSIANVGKTTEINESNIYSAIDLYVTNIIEKVSTKDRMVDPLLKNNVNNAIARYSTALWNTNSRGIAYDDGLGISAIFDPGYTGEWFKAVSYKILDEGLLFRNIHEALEYAEFTHDVIGGFCIARNVVFEGKNLDEIVCTLKSDELLKKLTSEAPEDRHPLSEDILKSVVFLCPRYTGKELFELIDNTAVVKASISVMRIIISREEGFRSFIEHFKTIKAGNPVLPHLLENVLVEILRSDTHIGLVELLKVILLRLQTNQLDLNWTEVLRRKSDEIIPYLYREIELLETNKENRESLRHKTLFISFLLSSTNRFLRDKATRLLVTIGKKYPELIFEVFSALEGINDLYVLERLIASLCGTFLQIDNKDLLNRVCHYLEDNYFKKLRTSHILILDYVDTLITYAAIHQGFEREILKPSERELIKWQKDIECTKEVTSDEQATWGFGPVDYDFAKYKIGSYLSSGRFEKDSNLPTIKESLAMVVWRAKELGYSDVLFEQLNIQINKERYDRYGGRGHVQTYGKKYSKIAFYELFGHNVIKGLRKDVEGNVGFRTSATDIDPTFPKKLHKRQLITRCFLPKKTEGIQEWIVRDDGVLFKDYYMRNNLEKTEADWVMLYGHLTQKSAEKNRIDINLYTITVPEVKVDIVVESIRANELYFPTLITENPYVMAGEIPWSENYRDWHEEREIYLPVSVYNRESKFELEVTNHAYVPSKKLAQSLELKINLNDFNLYTASNEMASNFILDDYSAFLYMRADLMRHYLMETKQSLIWIETIFKYGDYDNLAPKYDPSFKDYRSINVFKY